MRYNATLDQSFAGGFIAVGAVDLDEIAEDDVLEAVEPMTRVACVAPGPHDHNAFDVLWQVGVQQPAELRRRVDKAQRSVDAEIRRMLGGDFDHLRYTNVLAQYERAASNWKTVREALFLRAMRKWRAEKPATVKP